AAQRGRSLGLRFVREAITNSDLTPRLRARAEYVWQAALGLDLQHRAEAERLLLAELFAAEPDRRLGLALAAAALGDLSPETAEEAAEVLTQSIRNTADTRTLGDLVEELWVLAPRMGPQEAATACGAAAATLLRAMSLTKDLDTLSSLAQRLS